MNLAVKAGIEPHLNEPERHTATIVAHFGFGAAAGAMYATVQEKLPLSPMIGGACFGCAVWAASYLGWIPALRILPPATEHPARRNAIMITAHVVWGVSAGLLLQRAAAATTVITHPRALPKRQHQRPAS